MPNTPAHNLPRTPVPRITLLSTGGTIAGQSAASGGYRSGILGPEALIAAVPPLARLARLRAEALAHIGSQHMTADVWLSLARRITELFAQDEADGVVISHGTDTLEETAYFLNLVLPGSQPQVQRPVVLVGAMRPADAVSADGPANLLNAVAVASHPAAHGHGPLVVANEQIYRAREVQKISASGLHAFAAPNGGAVGQVYGQHVILQNPLTSAQSTTFQLPNDPNLPRVDVVYACADQDGDAIDALATQPSLRGIVLAGTGAGNGSYAVIAALARAAARGIVVVRASRTGSGYVGASGEIDDTAHGFVTAGTLAPAKARILLRLALAQGADLAAIRRHFAEHGHPGLLPQ